MRKITTLMMILLIMTATGTVFAGEDAGAVSIDKDEACQLEDMLLYALQDEMKARAEYLAIMDEFGVDEPFSNIAESEARHIELVLGLYELIGCEVPYFNPEPYVVLPDTLEETFAIGIQAEIDNIQMYDFFLNGTSSSVPVDVCSILDASSIHYTTEEAEIADSVFYFHDVDEDAQNETLMTLCGSEDNGIEAIEVLTKLRDGSIDHLEAFINGYLDLNGDGDGDGSQNHNGKGGGKGKGNNSK